MRSIIIFVQIMVISTLLKAQSSKLDSLLSRMTTETDDSLVCALTGNAGYYLATRNYDSSMLLLNRAIVQAQDRGYADLNVRFLCFQGMSNTINGELQEAVKSFEKAIEIGEMASLDSAVAQANFGLANVLESQGDLPRSLQHYHLALSYFEAHGFEKAVIGVKANLAVVYSTINDYDKAKPLILETNEYYKKKGLSQRLINGYQRLASVFSYEDQSDSALYYLKEAENMAIRENNLFSLSVIENHLGNTYLALEQYDRAIQAYSQSIDHKKNLGKNSEEYLKTFANMAYCHAVVGNQAKARSWLDQGEQLFDQIETLKFRVHYYKMKYKVDSVLGSYDQALFDHQIYTQLKDELFDEEKSRQLTEMETKYETEKKANEIKALSQQSMLQSLKIKQQRMILGGVVLLVLIVAILSYYFWNQRRLKQKQMLLDLELEETKKRLNLERRYKQSEVKAIKAQMNPHFVFNALNSIQDLIMLKDIRSSNEYLGKFANLMRKTLEASGKDHLELSEEIELLRHYLELEKLRFGEEFQYQLTCDIAEGETVDWAIPPLLLQPYVENAIKHGLLHKKGPKVLKVHFFLENGALLCEIIDNGVGRKKSHEINKRREGAHTSFATSQNDKRIALINESSDFDISLVIQDLIENDEVAGTRVRFSFSHSTVQIN